MTVIRRSDGREWRIENSDEGIPLVFGDGKYDHDPPRVASRLESALAEQLRGAVEALREAVALLDVLVDPDDLPLDVGDRLDSVRRASRRLGGQ